MVQLAVIKKTGKFSFIGECVRCNNQYTSQCIYSAKKSYVGNLCNPCKYFISKMVSISQQKLKYAFKYDPLTGVITHRHDFHSRLKGALATHDHSGGYLSLSIGGKALLAHRVIFMYMTGELPNEVDHVNHIRNDNRWSNLRAVVRTDNNRNTCVSLNNTTGVTGVSYHKPTGKFRAYISQHGKAIHLGLFTTLEEAATVREKANLQYGYHPNHGK